MLADNRVSKMKTFLMILIVNGIMDYPPPLAQVSRPVPICRRAHSIHMPPAYSYYSVPDLHLASAGIDGMMDYK
jgi:hypothetical protein